MDRADEARLAAARRQGEAAADGATVEGPDEPLSRIAWAVGFGHVDQLQAAVDRAREAGLTWKQIAAATGDHWRTAQTKYGGGRERNRLYQARRRQKRES